MDKQSYWPIHLIHLYPVIQSLDVPLSMLNLHHASTNIELWLLPCMEKNPITEVRSRNLFNPDIALIKFALIDGHFWRNTSIFFQWSNVICALTTNGQNVYGYIEHRKHPSAVSIHMLFNIYTYLYEVNSKGVIPCQVSKWPCGHRLRFPSFSYNLLISMGMLFLLK